MALLFAWIFVNCGNYLRWSRLTSLLLFAISADLTFMSVCPYGISSYVVSVSWYIQRIWYFEWTKYIVCNKRYSHCPVRLSSSLHFIPELLVHLNPLRNCVSPLLHCCVRYVVFSLKIHIVVTGNKLVQILCHALANKRQLFSVVKVIWVHRHDVFYVNLNIAAGFDVSVLNVLRDSCRNRKQLLRQLT